jgi:hypothetical protein
MSRDAKDLQRLVEQAPEWANDQPMATKAHNGPRFATEVDTSPVHVPSPEMAQRPQPKAKTTKRRSTVPADPLPLDAEMAVRVVAFAIEREAIRKRREAGQPWPWTDDPILCAGYFCNVHRENDAATRRLSFGLVQPYRDVPDLWFAVALARCINEPATWLRSSVGCRSIRTICATFSKRATRAVSACSGHKPISHQRRRTKATTQFDF